MNALIILLCYFVLIYIIIYAILIILEYIIDIFKHVQ